MQRVLSIQTARGFGESSEFVTKRMCFSFLFSIGFLCLLCGFLIGRFAAQRAVDIRAEREQNAVAGNGLESSEQLRQKIIEQLGEKGFDGPTDLTRSIGGHALKNVKNTFAALDFFSKLSVNGTCLTATITGTHERDRYVALTTGGEENIDIVLEIVQELHKSTTDNDWKPRRNLMFLLYENSMNDCFQLFSDYEESKIVALLTIDKNPITGDGYFVSSGSDVVQTTVLESVRNYGESKTHGNTYLPRLKLSIPHSIITFVGYKNGTSLEDPNRHQQIASHRKQLAKILTTSLWKLSQMNIFQWNPQILESTMEKAFSNLTSLDLRPYIQQIKEKLTSITEYGRALNERIEGIDGLKSLEVRMTNDLLKDVERALLCPDDNHQSRTDVALINKLQKNQEISQVLAEMLSCFERVIKMLQDMT